ncbi:hypothetical protein C2G38_2204254 [Gigaspora rosea]|uniref:Cyanovirin-N domain-containing protein n=1 Tax=Gigaspora rosea TaxID=44941 RepID=A0A397UV99_9GLOM|nr:hypothetical protein C2G38_2204254 [Gigaspora rosea]
MLLFKPFILICLILLGRSTVLGQSNNTNTNNTSSSSTGNFCGDPINDPCLNANKSISVCGGSLIIPINPGNNTATILAVTDKRLANCQCNSQYYKNLTSCVSCYSSNNIGNVSVANLNDYKSACTKLGIPFTDVRFD